MTKRLLPMGRQSETRTISEIAKELGLTRTMVQYDLARAMWKVKRACRRLGLDASDVVGTPTPMTARLEWYS